MIQQLLYIEWVVDVVAALPTSSLVSAAVALLTFADNCAVPSMSIVMATMLGFLCGMRSSFVAGTLTFNTHRA